MVFVEKSSLRDAAQLWAKLVYRYLRGSGKWTGFWSVTPICAAQAHLKGEAISLLLGELPVLVVVLYSRAKHIHGDQDWTTSISV